MDRAATLKTGTLGHRLAAVAVAHALAGHPNPASRRDEPLCSIWLGIRREKGSRKTQKAPFDRKILRRLVSRLPLDEEIPVKRLRAVRDRALLLVGFAGAFRRWELVELRIEDLAFSEQGVRVLIRRSKTDAGGEGAEIGLPSTGTPLCPVVALRAWLEAAALTAGPVFRAVRHGGTITESLSPEIVARLVKKHVQAAGLDPDLFFGHSLRAGLVTEAATAGAREVDIMRHSRHRSVPVLREYVRKATVWVDNAAAAALGA